MNAQLVDFRNAIDDFMEHHPQSPLTGEQRDEFKTLNYYEENKNLIMEVEVERFSDDEPLIEMTTNTGDIQFYRRWGQFSFDVADEEAALVIYSDEHGHEFFIPFRDSTNGHETYGAGRYLDNQRPGVQRIGENQFEIDFNYAYNPYCAYNSAYSCPLPPRENWLNVPIEAGEKDFG